MNYLIDPHSLHKSSFLLSSYLFLLTKKKCTHEVIILLYGFFGDDKRGLRSQGQLAGKVIAKGNNPMPIRAHNDTNKW